MGERSGRARSVRIPRWLLWGAALAPLWIVGAGVAIGWQLRPGAVPEPEQVVAVGAEHPGATAPEAPGVEESEPETHRFETDPGDGSQDGELADECSGRRPADRTGFGGRVALTFDDGPDPSTTRVILATLRRHEAPATFFINGERVADERARELVREMVGDPLFMVGNHGFSHADLASLDPVEVEREVRATGEIIEGLGGRPRFFRFPFGKASCDTVATVRRLGYEVVGWHVNSADWCYDERNGYCRPRRDHYVPDPLRRDMAGFVSRQVNARGGGIVLFHEGLSITVAELDGILGRLKEQGVTFVALDDVAAFPRLNGVAVDEARADASDSGRPVPASLARGGRPRERSARPPRPPPSAAPAAPSAPAAPPTPPAEVPPTPGPTPAVPAGGLAPRSPP